MFMVVSKLRTYLGTWLVYHYVCIMYSMWYMSIVSIVFYLNYIQSANILGVFMVPSLSHQIVYQPIWRELSLRGHNVTVVTPDPLNDPSLTNLTEISVRRAYDIWKHTKMQEMMSKDANVFYNLHLSYQLLDVIAEMEINSTQFQNLIWDKNRTFDLILVESFYPAMYALTQRFKAPTIGFFPIEGFVVAHDVVGNQNHPVLYPDANLNYQNKDISIWQKVINMLYGIWCIDYRYYISIPKAEKLVNNYFSSDVYDLLNLEKNISMMCLNTNLLMFRPRPRVPAILETGQAHIKIARPLPKDLGQFLDEAQEGVIYFSLGSNIKSLDLDVNLRKTIIGALSELPYKVIWKWENDHLPNKPSNVITRKWLPQQDLLAHPNIRAFVTQGGLQSIEEAIARAVPLVCLPFIGDQPTNVRRVSELGIGIGLNPSTVTKDELRKAIIEVSENQNYRRRILKARNILFDRPMNGIEKAVWWSEYVIRYKGARHLRSPSADISWFYYLMLDVFLTIVATIVFLYCACKMVLTSFP